jgi:hypothetical protein
MRSYRDKKRPTIVLAANSPLYAPIFLAQAESVNGVCSQMKLELAKYPSTFRRGAADVDPFIDRLLSEANVNAEILIGIGDPMRITAVPKTKRYVKPKIAGSLIHKMCYWLVNHRAYKNVDWEDAFEFVLVHPKGMSGFTVPYCDYAYRNSTNDFTPLKGRLIDDVDPNNERQFYDQVYGAIKSKNRKPSLAFITTNPLHASDGCRFAIEYELVRAFASEDRFQDVIMTGIIVPEEQYEIEASTIEEFKMGIITAIQYILNDPGLAAYRLYRGFEEGKVSIRDSENNKVKPFFATWSIAELKETLASLERYAAYNPSGTITPAQWKKTKEMRATVEPLLDEMERKRSVAELTDDYCSLTTPLIL